jgi:hypothetical protein
VFRARSENGRNGAIASGMHAVTKSTTVATRRKPSFWNARHRPVRVRGGRVAHAGEMLAVIVGSAAAAVTRAREAKRARPVKVADPKAGDGSSCAREGASYGSPQIARGMQVQVDRRYARPDIIVQRAPRQTLACAPRCVHVGVVRRALGAAGVAQLRAKTRNTWQHDRAGNAVCVHPFDTANPSTSFCSSTCPCELGEGDCDPGQCANGLTCVDDRGASYGLPSTYDICYPRARSSIPLARVRRCARVLARAIRVKVTATRMRSASPDVLASTTSEPHTG